MQEGDFDPSSSSRLHPRVLTLTAKTLPPVFSSKGIGGGSTFAGVLTDATYIESLGEAPLKTGAVEREQGSPASGADQTRGNSGGIREMLNATLTALGSAVDSIIAAKQGHALAIRERTDRAKSIWCVTTSVERYVRMLEKGSTPPAIKVDGNVIVEGNHRYVAGRFLALTLR